MGQFIYLYSMTFVCVCLLYCIMCATLFYSSCILPKKDSSQINRHFVPFLFVAHSK